MFSSVRFGQASAARIFHVTEAALVSLRSCMGLWAPGTNGVAGTERCVFRSSTHAFFYLLVDSARKGPPRSGSTLFVPASRHCLIGPALAATFSGFFRLLPCPNPLPGVTVCSFLPWKCPSPSANEELTPEFARLLRVKVASTASFSQSNCVPKSHPETLAIGCCIPWVVAIPPIGAAGWLKQDVRYCIGAGKRSQANSTHSRPFARGYVDKGNLLTVVSSRFGSARRAGSVRPSPAKLADNVHKARRIVFGEFDKMGETWAG
jgi:hypothetical protein